MGKPKPFHKNMKDAALIKKIALPDDESTTVVTLPIQVAENANTGHAPDAVEFLLEVPPMTTTMVPNSSTITAIIEVSDVEDFSSNVMQVASKQEAGAGGEGIADGISVRGKIPAGYTFVRGKVTSGASVTDSSTLNAELSLLC